jgi:hypothetical protein
MATISTLEAGLANRLEETPGATIFWDSANELRPLLVEAFNLATLITGEPQVYVTSTTTIAASTSFAPIAMPAGALAITRIDCNGLPVEKSYVQDLDCFYPGWEVMTGPLPRYWMPFGLTQFGIFPNLASPVPVSISYVGFPVTTLRPYTGSEPIPFQSEYLDSFQDWAAAMATYKEGSPEFDEAMAVLNRFLAKMESLSDFAYRKGSLRFSRGVGSTSNIVETRVK